MIEQTSRPRRIGIILNPKGGHVRRHLIQLRQLAKQVPDATVIEASSPDTIAEAVNAFELAAEDLLVVIGGDGSVQATLTAMLRLEQQENPRVLIVAAGTTNMSAADLGVRLKPAAALQALHDWVSGKIPAPATRPRAVLQVTDSSLMPAQYGLFFGAGAIISGVRYFHGSVRPKGIRGALGPSLAFMRMLLSILSNREHRLLPATTATLHLKKDPVRLEWLLVLATTLDTLLMGSTPYWGTEKAPMHFTAIAHRAPRLLVALFFLLRGKSNAMMRNNQGYRSHNLTHSTIEDLTEYLLDGEIFATQGPLHLSATAAVRFILI
jgi:diacylglycerol kinase (ATP)